MAILMYDSGLVGHKEELTVPFSSKLIADYVEMINQALDTIAIKSDCDIANVVDALMLITLEKPILKAISTLNEDLRESLESIAEFYHSPDMYVRDPKDYDAYQKILADRIIAKIETLKDMSLQDVSHYIQQREATRQSTQGNHALISAAVAPEPGSDAHTISEEAMLYEYQREYNEGGAVRFLDVLQNVIERADAHPENYTLDDIDNNSEVIGSVVSSSSHFFSPPPAPPNSPSGRPSPDTYLQTWSSNIG